MVRFETIFGLRIPLDEGENHSAACPTATCFSDQDVLQIFLWICKESFEDIRICSLYYKFENIHIIYIYDIHMQIYLYIQQVPIFQPRCIPQVLSLEVPPI